MIYFIMLSIKQGDIFSVFGMTQPGIEYWSPSNHFTCKDNNAKIGPRNEFSIFYASVLWTEGIYLRLLSENGKAMWLIHSSTSSKLSSIFVPLPDTICLCVYVYISICWDTFMYFFFFRPLIFISSI